MNTERYIDAALAALPENIPSGPDGWGLRQVRKHLEAAKTAAVNLRRQPATGWDALRSGDMAQIAEAFRP